MEPKQIKNFFITFITTISAAIIFFIEYDRIKTAIFPKNELLNPVSVTLLVLITNFLVFIVVYTFLHKEKVLHEKTKTLYDNSQIQLADKKRNEITDVITGIPNEIKFIRDVERLDAELYQLILIDLDNFSEINSKFGHDRGDKLIRFIAQNLYKSMRRDEEIYKRETKPQKSLIKRIYRKYRGGDEFIFLIKGAQHEAVGFLNRVNRDFEKYSRETKKILGNHFELKFHGAISPFYANEEFEQAYRRLHDCYVLASEEKFHRSIYWYEDEIKNISEKDFRIEIYNKAEEVFKR